MPFGAIQKHPRYQTNILVRVMHASTSQMAVRSLANISRGGVFVCSPELVTLGTPLHLILHPQGSPVGVTGKVVHILDAGLAAQKGHPQGFGLEFDTLTEQAISGVDPRFLDRTQVRLAVTERADLKELWLSNLSKGGLFVESPTPPEVGTRVSVELETPGGMLKLAADVVHTVTRESAAALGMPSGAGLQFVTLERPQRDALHAYIEGRAPTLQVQAEPAARNATAATVMGTVAVFFTHVEKQDPLGALQLRKDAGDAEIAARVEQLRAMFSNPPADATAAQRTRLDSAARTLVRVESHLRRAPKVSVDVTAASSHARSTPAAEVQPIIQKYLVEARDHEAASRFAQAREMLIRLREIAPNHPGLGDRIASLKDRVDREMATALLDDAEAIAETSDAEVEVARRVRKALDLTLDRTLQLRGMHLFMRVRDLDAARRVAVELTGRFPDDQAAWAVLVHIHEKSSNWGDALNAAEELFLLRPNDSQLKDQVDDLRAKVRRR